MMQPSRTLVIGIGNDSCGDDGVGLVAARRLRERARVGVSVLEHDRDGASLMEAWMDAHTVILVDAAHSGADPGTIHRFDATMRPLPAAVFPLSTHAVGVGEGIELARALNRLPVRLVVYGIEGKDFRPGSRLSPEVQGAVDVLVYERIPHDLEGECRA